MSEYVLFSPIGGSDPINACHDGPMLHICRCYRPKVVFLYLSADMLNKQELDDRFRKCINILYSELGAEVNIITEGHPEITNPQKFDQFDADFRRVLSHLREEYPDCELLGNISSGTPAMKAGLKTVAATSLFRIRCVQVSSNFNNEPSKGSTERDKGNLSADEPYDCELYWLTNEDNVTFTNRCSEPDNRNFIALFIKENICRYAEAYDYHAALEEAKSISQLIPPDAVTLLSAAKARTQIVPNALEDKLGSDAAARIIAPHPTHTAQLREYILWLNLKFRRKDISDFIRGITPALYRLAIECLKAKHNIDILSYCDKDNRGVYRLSISKLQNTADGMKVIAALDQKYGSYDYNKPLNSDACITIIRGLSDSDTAKSLEKLRKVETDVRNIAAHEINPITEKMVHQSTGCSMNEIMKMIKTVSDDVLGFTPEDWDSYDRINKRLRDLLGQGLDR